MMVVVDADPLPSDSDPHCLVSVMYLDDCNTLRRERLPWGILSVCSVATIEAESHQRCAEMDEEFSAREIARTAARLKALRDEVSSSSDPASFFGLLRSAVVDLLKSTRDLGAGCQFGGVSDDAQNGTRVLEYQEDITDVRRSGTRSRGVDVSVEFERGVLASASDDPLAGRGGAPMACLSQSELAVDPTAHQRESLGKGDSYCGRTGEPFSPHVHFDKDGNPL